MPEASRNSKSWFGRAGAPSAAPAEKSKVKFDGGGKERTAKQKKPPGDPRPDDEAQSLRVSVSGPMVELPPEVGISASFAYREARESQSDESGRLSTFPLPQQDETTTKSFQYREARATANPGEKSEEPAAPWVEAVDHLELEHGWASWWPTGTRSAIVRNYFVVRALCASPAVLCCPSLS